MVLELAPAVLELAPVVLELAPAVLELAPAVLEWAPVVLELAPVVVKLAPAALELVPALVRWVLVRSPRYHLLTLHSPLILLHLHLSPAQLLPLLKEASLVLRIGLRVTLYLR